MSFVAVKSRFEFPVTLGRAQLTEPVSIKFAATGTVAIKQNGKIIPRDIAEYEIEIRLEHEKGSEGNPNANDTTLFVTLPGDPESYFPVAQRVAAALTNHLAFFYPGFKIEGGYLAAERVPETPEEAATLGEKRHWVQVSFREVDGPVPFDRENLRTFPHSIRLERVLRQYNAANSSENEIDAFLGMFKVIETLFHAGRGKARATLKSSSELRELLRGSFRTKIDGEDEWKELAAESVDGMIDDLVKTRDNCAHLREQNAFGYAPGDRDITEQVAPILDILRFAARKAIVDRIDRKQGASRNHSTE